MKIKINQQFHEVSDHITVLQLMKWLFPDRKSFGMAVAINQEIIDKSLWSTHVIQEHDSLTLIKATQGG